MALPGSAAAMNTCCCGAWWRSRSRCAGADPIRSTAKSGLSSRINPEWGAASGLFVLALVLALAADLLELGKHRLHVEFTGRLLGSRRLRLRLCRGHFGWQQRHALLGRRRLLLGGARDLEIEINLRAQSECDRIHRLQVGGVPMGAFADRTDRRLGGADEPHDLAVLELRMIAHQPQDRVRPVLPA